MYYIWLDESDKSGTYYSNFYGGIFINSDDMENVIRMSQFKIKELALENEEIKWQKVNKHNFEKYKLLVDFIFDLLQLRFIKIRIFFRNNQFVPEGLTKEQKKKEYPLLYYQFIKHAFGLQYSNPEHKEISIRLLLDDIPLKGADVKEFKDFIYRLNFDPGFKKAHLHINQADICEVDSKKHLPLQFMDLILGSICFRLNDKHKIKDPHTGKRGTRTKLKEKLYKHINGKIREIHPGFNVGVSTGIRDYADRWNEPYLHWSFRPSNYIRDLSKAKK
jgi:hypothetical protein